MKGKQILCAVMACLLAPLSVHAAVAIHEAAEDAPLRVTEEITLAKSELGNPFLGFDENGEILYGGDPSILADGDTVYAYIGHDSSEIDWYQMPDYRAYSSKDLIHWKYENKVLDMRQVKWALDTNTAWASQTIKYKGKYYLLFCTTSNLPGEQQGHCIGVAESDTPTGTFVPQDQPLILNSQTGIGQPWYDIDPTAWVEKDADGKDEKLYISWGNTYAYVCEADADAQGHLYVKDQNQNGTVSLADGDIVQFNFHGNPQNALFNEALYLYRRQDETGRHYGDYYVFYAAGWREQIAYSTTSDLMSGELEFGGIVMPPSSTSNTNHEAVFDWKGKSYFVYHSGALPWGSGFRRSACIEEFAVNEDGTIPMIQETSTGLSGTVSRLFTQSGEAVAHDRFVNAQSDMEYPMVRDVFVSSDAEEEDASWEIEKGKADEDNPAYVSIQAYNKPGLYLCAEQGKIIMKQDFKRDDTETAARMTFRTLQGFAGSGVTFESVSDPGFYLTVRDGAIVLEKNPDAEQCSFRVTPDATPVSLHVMKTKRMYREGSTLNVDDLRVTVTYENGDSERITDYTTNAAEINMNRAGRKKLVITYKKGEHTIQEEVEIRVVAAQTTATAAGDKIGMASQEKDWQAFLEDTSWQDVLRINGVGEASLITNPSGGTLQLEVIEEPYLKNVTDQVTWAIDKEELASISDTGLVTAKKPGSVTVSASATIDGKQKTGKLVVDILEADSTYKDNFQNIIDQYEVPEWFRDAKFGVFVHWGVYSVPAYYSEWIPTVMYADGQVRDEMIRRYGPYSEHGYKDFIPEFRGENYDPEAWADLFAQAGAKYVVPVAEHHDGVAMYDSELTRWNMADIGLKTDVVGTLGKEVRARNMKFGVSNHFLENEFFYDAAKEGDDAADPRWWDLYNNAFDVVQTGENTRTYSSSQMQMWYSRSKELIDNYHPDLLYYDWTVDANRYTEQLFSYYYNQAEADNPDGVVINYKHNLPDGCAVYDIERGQAAGIRTMPWQTCTSISNLSWGYIENDQYKDAVSILNLLIDVVSKNGNLLLNVGPDKTGQIPPDAVQTFREIGKWLERNGEGIYATRPWTVCGEGPTLVGGGKFEETNQFVAEDIRFTTSKDGKNLYVIGMKWPESGEIQVKTLAGDETDLKGLKRISLLGSTEEIRCEARRDALSMELPDTNPNGNGAPYVVKLEFI